MQYSGLEGFSSMLSSPREGEERRREGGLSERGPGNNVGTLLPGPHQEQHRHNAADHVPEEGNPSGGESGEEEGRVVRKRGERGERRHELDLKHADRLVAILASAHD
jgi:hypothetical protein